MHACPIKGHGTTPIVSASPDTQINSLGAARVGDICGCGAVITTGFPSILINGRPLAHLGSPTSHGGSIISASSDTFGGFQFGGGATNTIVNFAKLGAVRPDGTVDDQLMTELLADPKLEQRAFLSDALVQPNGSILAPVEALTPELIAVVGSQHDNGSGNKMMFVGQAVRELAEFKHTKPSLTRTLVVFTPEYTEPMLSAARRSAQMFGAGFVTVATTQELIEYLNRGKDRQQSPIEQLSLFSHGVPQHVEFGYELPERAAMSLNVSNYLDISPTAFSSSALIASYACRTGMGNLSDYAIEDSIQLFPQTNQSLAQLLANHLQIKVLASIRRSDYKNTWGSFEERRMGDLCGISDNAAPGEQWCRQWVALRDERALSHQKHLFTYQIMGAINPVISGDTPIGVPGGFYEFLPK
tara:strand:- start:725 stop:1966 length:1242 start_codon:yes stop_codon:yes gene_type:complete